MELPGSVSLGMLMAALDAKGISVEDVQLDAQQAMTDGGRSYLVAMVTQKRSNRPDMMEQIAQALKEAEIALPCFRII